MVEDNKVAAAIAVAEGASVVDTAVEVVRTVATAEVIPRRYFAVVRMSEVVCNRVAVATAVASMVVAIVAVDIADLCLVVVASFIPLSTLHHTLSIQCVY